MKVVALSAWKRSGKDSLADHLVANHGATRLAFADPLKDMVADEYGVSRETFESADQKEQPILSMPVDPQDAFSRLLCEFMFKEFRTGAGNQPAAFSYVYGKFMGDHGLAQFPLQLYWTPRALAILKGSTNRSVQSNYWVSKAIDQAKAKAKGGLIVISDMRYCSEMKQLREAFGNDLITMRIERFDSSPSSDPSERDLDHATFDFTIQNRKSLASFLNDFDQIILDLERNIRWQHL